jgi:hypothetical protein
MPWAADNDQMIVWVIVGFIVAPIVLVSVVAIIDNRRNYGRWLPKRSPDEPQPSER